MGGHLQGAGFIVVVVTLVSIGKAFDSTIRAFAGLTRVVYFKSLQGVHVEEVPPRDVRTCSTSRMKTGYAVPQRRTT